MVKELANSATRALGKITVKLKAMGGLTYSGYTKLYNSIVDPILTYASGVWGTKEYKILNTVQNKARRQYLGVPLRTPNMATWGDMGWTSVTSRLRQEVIHLQCRIHKMPDGRLPKTFMVGQEELQIIVVKTGHIGSNI
jgi:hypothetical protein